MRAAYLWLGAGILIILIGASFALTHTTQMRHTISSSFATTTASMAKPLTLTSPVFLNGASIPPRFTCDRENVNPPLVIESVPEGAKSLTLIMEDPDIPAEVKQSRGLEVIDHWILFNIPPDTKEINEGDSVGTPGANSKGTSTYSGPCPPTQYEPKEHRYYFKLYALDTMLDLQPGAPKPVVLKAMQGHILEQTELIGRYQRHEN